MTFKAMPVERQQRIKGAIEAALRAGFNPRGQRGGKGWHSLRRPAGWLRRGMMKRPAR